MEIYRTFAAPILFMLPAEAAHRFSIWALKHGLVPGSRQFQTNILATEFCGLSFPNPIGLAAGYDKDCEIPGALLDLGFGFVEAIAKIGVERRVYTAGENKSVLDPFQPEKKEDIERLKSMQLDIHKIFIDMVKERRGAKLADDPELFTGAFWAGHKAKELGLVDHIGDMRSFLKERYGEKTELRLVQPQRNLFGRRQATGIISALNGVDAEALTAAAGTGLANAMEDRSIWARYGL